MIDENNTFASNKYELEVSASNKYELEVSALGENLSSDVLKKLCSKRISPVIIRITDTKQYSFKEIYCFNYGKLKNSIKNFLRDYSEGKDISSYGLTRILYDTDRTRGPFLKKYVNYFDHDKEKTCGEKVFLNLINDLIPIYLTMKKNDERRTRKTYEDTFWDIFRKNYTVTEDRNFVYFPYETNRENKIEIETEKLEKSLSKKIIKEISFNYFKNTLVRVYLSNVPDFGREDSHSYFYSCSSEEELFNSLINLMMLYFNKEDVSVYGFTREDPNKDLPESLKEYMHFLAFTENMLETYKKKYDLHDNYLRFINLLIGRLTKSLMLKENIAHFSEGLFVNVEKETIVTLLEKYVKVDRITDLIVDFD